MDEDTVRRLIREGRHSGVGCAVWILLAFVLWMFWVVGGDIIKTNERIDAIESRLPASK